MTITTSDKTFRDLTGNVIDDQSFLRTFTILVDDDRITNFLDIFRSYNFNEATTEDVTFYYWHEVGHEEWWDNISNQYYGTPLLWWVVASFNDIVNPFEALRPGNSVKVLKTTYIYSLLRDLDTISEV